MRGRTMIPVDAHSKRRAARRLIYDLPGSNMLVPGEDTSKPNVTIDQHKIPATEIMSCLTL